MAITEQASFASKYSAQGCVMTRVLYRVLKCLAGIVAVLVPWSASAANDVPTKLEIVWSFTREGLVYPCYDRTFAVIYLKYDAARKVSSIWKRQLNGEEYSLAEFPGVRESRSLSCSQDGQTIAAVAQTDINSGREFLFLLRGNDTALYKIPDFWPFSRMGTYTLLAPNGKAIALPETPTLVAGTDLLRDMRIFSNEPNNVFFMEHYAYSDPANDIVRYEYADGVWKERSRQVVRPTGFGPVDIARCGDHDVASLIGSDSSRVMVLGEASPSRQDWLGRIGVRKLFEKYEVPEAVVGAYGACAFPLYPRHMHRAFATGLARLDANGLQIFSFPYASIRATPDGVYFSKDGCYVLLDGVWSAPEVPGNIHLLAVQSPQCR